MATMLEFWQNNNQIYVEFNSKKYTLTDFIKLPECRDIFELMYAKILRDYSGEVTDKKNKSAVVGTFIKKHFLKKDGVYDVIIYNDGKVIKFNIED